VHLPWAEIAAAAEAAASATMAAKSLFHCCSPIPEKTGQKTKKTTFSYY
jgi:hypothetical protein